ncbi:MULTISPECIES: BRO family protein [unclassified Haematobacter]|uniref:BRO family protein n=1 Tax=unclassified Haematobacter TaxID=2640585 RepID=UPI0025BD5EF0|nr:MULTISPECIES: BRO family protein [unclassified Haematobacter]
MKDSNENEIFQFEFKGITLRAVKIAGEPWFVAVDLYSALFGRTTGISARSFLTDDEQMVIRKLSAYNALSDLFSGARYQLALISESGLYKLIMRAKRKNPVAREFQDWVTRDVLPAIRKDGGYIMGEEKVVTGEMSEDELVLKALTLLNGKVDRLRVEKEKLERENGKLEKENGKLTAELTSVTLAEYAAINHVYFTQSEKGRITAAVRKL